MDFTELIDLASERLGGAALFANDEFFAPKENLLKPSAPIFIEGKYTDLGKWMDGWETRRRRTPGYDWCLIRLGLPGIIRGVVVDTSFFRGNYPEQCSLEACNVPGQPDVAQLTSEATEWREILPQSQLKGDSQNSFRITDERRVTHLRFKIFPDGGVARLRVYGVVLPDWDEIKRIGGQVDLAAVENGGLVLSCSNMFFGHRHNLIMPGRALNMSDGWETKRRRGPGYDWVIIRLGAVGEIKRLEVDTSWFKGNFPDSCSLEACNESVLSIEDPAFTWKPVLPQTKLQAHTRHFFENEVLEIGAASYARFNIYPDGGVSRLRIYGTITSEFGWNGIDRLNSLAPHQAEAEFLKCCGSKNWARRMVDQRPFVDVPQLLDKADETWWSMAAADWLEASRSHPKIGEQKAEQAQSATARTWSEQEQVGTRNSDQETIHALAVGNQQYVERFGYIFIVCATGKTSAEMLEILRNRLPNEADDELRIAAEEQRKITQLRLQKLISDGVRS